MLSQDSPNDFQVSAAPPKIGQYKTKLESKIHEAKQGATTWGRAKLNWKKEEGIFPYDI